MKRVAMAIILLMLTSVVLLGVLLGAMMQPKIVHEKSTFRISPTSTPTGTPSPPIHIDKTSLIIQQNWMCWIGQPGATCGPERTYV